MNFGGSGLSGFRKSRVFCFLQFDIGVTFGSSEKKMVLYSLSFSNYVLPF